MKKFSCVQDCSDCCIYREYYPSIEYGKIGVLLLPEERAEIEQLARDMNVKVRIIPRLAIGKDSPEKIIAYQMMGKNDDGACVHFLKLKATKAPLTVDLNAGFILSGRLHAGRTL